MKGIETMFTKEQIEKWKAYFAGVDAATETVEKPTEEPKEEPTKVEMAEAKLKDGSTIVYDGELAIGTPVFVVTEEGNVEAPDGDHELEAGGMIVTEAGLVVDIKEPEAELEEEEEMQDDKLQNIIERLEVLENKFNAENPLNGEVEKLKEFTSEIFSAVEELGNAPSEEPTEDKSQAAKRERKFTSRIDKIRKLKQK